MKRYPKGSERSEGKMLPEPVFRTCHEGSPQFRAWGENESLFSFGHGRHCGVSLPCSPSPFQALLPHECPEGFSSAPSSSFALWSGLFKAGAHNYLPAASSQKRNLTAAWQQGKKWCLYCLLGPVSSHALVTWYMPIKPGPKRRRICPLKSPKTDSQRFRGDSFFWAVG